eukprot:GHVS01102740.1.p1 GENE.GHVS01102740.1~~GHVS01102740.1.p1  ORF type:complete len:192 (-),score=10.18 GHVS01102740.1:175-750(-)
MANSHDASKYPYTGPPQYLEGMNVNQNFNASQSYQNTGDGQTSFHEGRSYYPGGLGDQYGGVYPTTQLVDTTSQGFREGAYNYADGQGYQDVGQRYPGYGYSGGIYPDMQASGQSYGDYAGTTLGLSQTAGLPSDTGVRAVAQVLFGGSGAFNAIPLGHQAVVFRKRRTGDCSPAWSNAFSTRRDPCECRR